MRKTKRLWALLAILVVACVVTFAVSRHEQQKEQIKTSGEVVLEIDPDSVQSLAWEYGDVSLAFHLDGDWKYDDDEAFPVDGEHIQQLLDIFSEFRAAFIIEDVTDLAQYGLDEPECSITIGTADGETEILLGDYSTMDEQRYVTTGDGYVYLAASDPLTDFQIELSDMVLNDEIPVISEAESISFTGAQDYEIAYDTESGESLREDDVYFAQLDSGALPLDTDKVESYLDTLSFLNLGEYYSYNATEDELAECGLDEPDLTVEVGYTNDDDESAVFTLSIGRSDEQKAEAESEEEDAETPGGYARVGDSQIIYVLGADDYEALLAASADDLRHDEILPAEFEDVNSISIELDGETYAVSFDGDGDDRTFLFDGEEFDGASLQSAIEGLRASEFTSDEPDGKLEIALTFSFDLDSEPSSSIELYRLDGESCLAVIDGEPTALVPRDSVVALIEAVNAVALG